MQDQEVIKQSLLDTMDVFHEFCERHSLNYYLVGGGLIGAIRHQGFIPWDDDLDVIMPKKDFEKLLSLSNEFDQPFKVDHYSLNKDFYRCCAAFINNKITVDNGSIKNNLTGATLDILCLYPTFRHPVAIKLHFKSVKLARALLIIKGQTYLRQKYSKPIYSLLNISNKFLKPIPKSVLISFLNIIENIKLNESPNIANLHGAWGDKEVVNKYMLEDRELYDFEGRKYWSMSFNHAHTWLTNIYGDYMTLPPKEKRIYRHIEKLVKVNNNYD